MKNILLIFICLFHYSALDVFSQSLSSTNNKAIKFFNEGRAKYEYKKNEEAYNLLSKAVSEDNNFLNCCI